MTTRVSCIIPAYNEEKTILGVVKTCLQTPEIEEIIVVNDGSTDQTASKVSQLKSKKVKIIEFLQNKGKGAAIAEGVKTAKNNILLFLDADLINLQPHHLSSLIWPVINQKADMSIATWNIGFKPDALLALSSPVMVYLSGQRCLKKKIILPYLKKIEKSKYALEILLNKIFQRKRIVVIPLFSPKIIHLTKRRKWKNWKSSYIKESLQIFQEFLKNKSDNYRQNLKKILIKNLAVYFKTSIKKIAGVLKEQIPQKSHF